VYLLGIEPIDTLDPINTVDAEVKVMLMSTRLTSLLTIELLEESLIAVVFGVKEILVVVSPSLSATHAKISANNVPKATQHKIIERTVVFVLNFLMGLLVSIPEKKIIIHYIKN
jgi:hypothetical protein